MEAQQNKHCKNFYINYVRQIIVKIIEHGYTKFGDRVNILQSYIVPYRGNFSSFTYLYIKTDILLITAKDNWVKARAM